LGWASYEHTHSQYRPKSITEAYQPGAYIAIIRTHSSALIMANAIDPVLNKPLTASKADGTLIVGDYAERYATALETKTGTGLTPIRIN